MSIHLDRLLLLSEFDNRMYPHDHRLDQYSVPPTVPDTACSDQEPVTSLAACPNQEVIEWDWIPWIPHPTTSIHHRTPPLHPSSPRCDIMWKITSQSLRNGRGCMEHCGWRTVLPRIQFHSLPQPHWVQSSISGAWSISSFASFCWSRCCFGCWTEGVAPALDHPTNTSPKLLGSRFSLASMFDACDYGRS